MKKLIPLVLTIALIHLIIFVSAQTPQGLNYQAVARNIVGSVLQNQRVGIRFSIHDGSPTAAIIFQETDTATTNQFGLFTTLIGNGTVTVGAFIGISWATGNKFLEVELDPNGGSSFSSMGTAQLVSVPYALYAQTSGNGGGVTGPTGPTGNNGLQGNTGLTAATGNTGSTGNGGATGPTGATGASGAIGNNGAAGVTGLTGLAGVTGNTGSGGGATGPTGATGNNGNNGTTGATGATGGNGSYGVTGNNGTNGVTGATGATGFLSNGAAAGNTTYWNGTSWVVNSSNIFNNGGNVGIGTTAPIEILDVLNAANSTGYNNIAYFRVGNNSGATNYSRLLLGQVTTNKMFIEVADQSNTKGNLLLQPYGGNVGIGTSTPSVMLDVEADTTSPAFKLVDGTQGAGKVLTSDVNGNASWQSSTGGGSTHEIGDQYQGGIIISVWEVGGVQHGLIASLVDISTSAAWSNVTTTLIGATAQNQTIGSGNTTAIIAQTGQTSSAALLCHNYAGGGYSDWYLPAIWELQQCYNAARIVNTVLGNANGFQFTVFYWSSTESASTSAYGMTFTEGYPVGGGIKTTTCNVRAVRIY